MKYGMIPFFIPHVGCPHICTFCNQSRITEITNIDYLTPSYIVKTIEEYTAHKNGNKHWEVCFYGGSFSAISPSLQQKLLAPAFEALQNGKINGIRCSTRPDAVDDEALQLLHSYGVSTVELGVQSMNDSVLENAKRGHTSDDVRLAVQQLRNYNMTVGLQILPGLLGDSWHTIIETAIEIAKLEPDFVRIYPVLVIDYTELAEQYKHGIYTPLSVQEGIDYCAFLKTWFEEHGIKVIRTGLQSTDELDRGASLLAGPYEPAMGELVINEQWRQRLERCIEKHREAWHMGNMRSSIWCGEVYYRSRYEDKSLDNGSYRIYVEYPRHMTSKVRGLKNCNIKYFDNHYKSIDFTWRENNDNNWPICIIDSIQYML